MFYKSDHFFEKAPISMLIVYLQRSIIVSFGKWLLFVEKVAMFFAKGVPFPAEGVYLFEIPIVDICSLSIVLTVQCE